MVKCESRLGQTKNWNSQLFCLTFSISVMPLSFVVDRWQLESKTAKSIRLSPGKDNWVLYKDVITISILGHLNEIHQRFLQRIYNGSYRFGFQRPRHSFSFILSRNIRVAKTSLESLVKRGQQYEVNITQLPFIEYRCGTLNCIYHHFHLLSVVFIDISFARELLQ